MTKKEAAVIVLVMVALLSAAGCTNLSSQSHLQAFVNEFQNNANAEKGTFETIDSWQEISEGTDTIRVRYNVYNSSRDATYDTTTYDLRVKEFTQTSEATSFVNGMNEGYTTVTSNFASGSLNTSIYTKAVGHAPSKAEIYMKIDSVTPPKVSIIAQMDEFVVYGSVAELSGLK